MITFCFAEKLFSNIDSFLNIVEIMCQNEVMQYLYAVFFFVQRPLVPV